MWSVGCIMAELLTGQALFPGGDRILLDQLWRERGVVNTGEVYRGVVNTGEVYRGVVNTGEVYRGVVNTGGGVVGV